MRRAAKKDSNHPEIVAEFIRLGCSVLDISQLKNCADIVVGKGGISRVVEIKDGTKPPSARKLTSGELEFSRDWTGGYDVVENLADVARVVQKLEE